MIDRLPRPFAIANGWCLITMRRLEGPELLGLFEINAFFLSGGAVARISGPLLDPGSKVCDHRLGQLSAWRHLKFFIAESLKQQARRRIAWNDGRAPLTSFADAIPAVEEEPTSDFLRLGRVAFIALLYQDRANLLLEEFDLIGWRIRECANARQHHRQDKSDGPLEAESV